MKNKDYKQCPNCGKEAYGREEIEEDDYYNEDDR